MVILFCLSLIINIKYFNSFGILYIGQFVTVIKIAVFCLVHLLYIFPNGKCYNPYIIFSTDIKSLPILNPYGIIGNNPCNSCSFPTSNFRIIFGNFTFYIIGYMALPFQGVAICWLHNPRVSLRFTLG